MSKKVLKITCNWGILNNKEFHDVITIAPPSDLHKECLLPDVWVDETGNTLVQEFVTDRCMFNIKITDGRVISRIAVVSEAYVLEFFKECGEYATTVIAKNECSIPDEEIFFGETQILPPSTEVGIKFTKMKEIGRTYLWIFGIRLYLTPRKEPPVSPEYSLEAFQSVFALLTGKEKDGNDSRDKQFCAKMLNMAMKDSVKMKNKNDTERKAGNCSNKDSMSMTNVDANMLNKNDDLETRLMQRIDEMEERTNQKLDMIIKLLENREKQ